MYAFHVTVHARPAHTTLSEPATLRDKITTTLTAAEGLRIPFSKSFEEVAEYLEKLERLFFEPDGSFVWVGGAQQPWQLDGQLYDLHDRLLYVDLKGTCPEAAFDDFLRACGWPETQVVFQLVREAVLLDESAFRAYAEFPVEGS